MTLAKLAGLAGAIASMAGTVALYFSGTPKPPSEEGIGLLGLESGTVIGPGGVTVGDHERRTERDYTRKVKLAKAGWVALGLGFLLQAFSVFLSPEN